jgi:glycoside hydrolase family 2
MNKPILTAILLLASIMPEASAITRNRLLIDSDWKFTQKEDTMFSRNDCNDSGWEKISLPHDWSVLHDFDSNEPAGNDGGYLPTGKGWYRKTINIPDSMVWKPCDLYFEGVYMNSEVYCNGRYVGGHPYGYTSFRCNVGPYLKAGENVIAVSVDNSRQKNSRWYSGSGIYRHAWLEPHAGIFVKPWSLQITTPVVSAKRGIARINFTIVDSLKSNGKEALKLPVSINVSNRNGFSKTITDTVRIQPGEKLKYCSHEVEIMNPALWSCDNPALYKASVTLHLPDGTEETEYDTFGLRTIEYSADEGFKLNGKPMLISGACLHHDNGILGAASYDDAEYRKAKLLKDAGFNAVRTSHNPPAPAFIAACDSLGLLVIDEAFDGWKAAKNSHDYSELYDEWWDKDVSALVERDRNHPSVICWSIGNEIIERKSPEAVEMAYHLASKCRELDPTRPVTSALAAWDPAWEIYDPLASRHDIVGYNYMIHKAESDHLRVPSRVIWQTESYPRDAFKNWEKVNDHPYIIGDFVWTGLDYIGESGIGRYYYEGDPEGEHFHRPLWPWHNSYCGDVDIIGERKPISHYRELLYSESPKLYIAVREPDGYKGKIKETMWGTYPTVESWNWKGHEGKPIEVEIISNYPSVELLQDGKSIGKKKTDRSTEFKAIFEIPYKPGEIEAVAFDANGNRTASYKISTSGKPYAIRLRSDKEALQNTGQSLAYITAEVIDKKGNVVTDAELPLKFNVAGEAEIIATGSGNPKDPAGYFRKERVTDKGAALGVVRATGKKSKSGKEMIKVTVSSPGLKSATIQLPLK